MASNTRSSNRNAHAEVLVSVLSVLLVTVLGWYALRNVAPSFVAENPSVSLAAMRPGFDVVRIDPQGNPVISGRATPNTVVTVRSGDQVLGTARADARGEWVLVPVTALLPGSRLLTLSARMPDGQELANIASMALTVPERAGRSAATGAQQGGAGAYTGAMRLDMIGYGPGGQLNFSGVSAPGSLLRLFVNAIQIGETTADATGRWKLIPTVPVATGTYKLRVEQIGADGNVASRLELPFLRESEDRVASMDGRIVVQPGQTLSQIAQAAYNDASRFMVIFEANRDQLNDPNRIFPGQILTLPR